MDIIEFIERFKSSDKTLFDDIRIRKYIPIQEKSLTCAYICERLMIEAGVDRSAEKYIVSKEIYRLFDILFAYTNIHISKGQKCVETYNECGELGIDRLIMRMVPKQDYRTYCKMLDDMSTIRDTMLIRAIFDKGSESSMASELSTIVQTVSKNKEVFDSITNMFNALKT